MSASGDQSAGGSGAGGGGGDSSSASVVGRNLWDFLTVSVVILALLIAVIYLARHYPKSGDVVAVLGVVTPVLGAVFGATIGAVAGNAKGKADGAAQAKAKVKADLQPKVNTLSETTQGVLPPEHQAVVHPSVAEVRGYLDAL